MIRIGIVDDHAIVRAGLKQFLAEEVDFRVAKGETVGHIAEHMFLSIKTVSTWRSRVLEKLKVQSNSDLTYYALKDGLVQ